MKVPAARPEFGKMEALAVERVLATGMVTQGPEVERFEQEFSEIAVPGSQSVALNSGTSALHLALVALGVGPGDEVIVPAFTFAATANAVAFTGAKPVFADIDLASYCLDPEHVASLVTRRTRGVIPVHLYGHPADMSRLMPVCERFGLWILEDAAQAHLASWQNRPVGSFGVAGAFSFYPTKNMSACEGGMVTTLDSDLARSIRLLRNQGQERRYVNEIVGLNNRMTDIHAAVGRVQLQGLRKRTELRRRNAAFYSENLVGVVTPKEAEHARHVFNQYTIRVEATERNRLQSQLAERGIGTGIYYPTPVNDLAAYGIQADVPNTYQACQEVLSLPVYPSLSQDELDLVVESINELMRAGA